MGQGTRVPHLGRHQLLRMFPLRLLPVLCPEIPTTRPGWGLWAHWLSRRGTPTSATKSFPCTDTGPAAQPTWQDTRGSGEPREGVSLCLCCALALEAAMKSQLCYLPHTQKSQIFRSAGMVQHPAMLH